MALPSADATASFDGWSQDNEQDSSSSFTAEAGYPADGAIALRLGSTNPATNPTRRALSQVVAVSPSTTYSFTASVKGPPSSKAKPPIAVIMGADGQGRYDFASTTGAWSKQTWSYTTGAAETETPVSILTVGPVAGVTLDALSMTVEGANENLLANPSFEAFASDSPRITNDSLMLVSGADATLGVSWRVPGAAWTVTDATGAPVTSGTLDLQPGLAVVSLQDLNPGYYSIDIVNNDDGSDHLQTSLAILDPIANDASATDERFGVGVHLAPPHLNSGQVAGEIGFGTVRTDTVWRAIETTKGEYTFPPTEESMIQDYAAHGVGLLPLSVYVNKFYDNNKTPSTPEGLAAYAAFTSAVVAHYGSPAVEVYNEFNNPPMNKGACGPTAACYLPLLKATFERVKADHPETLIVGPSIARTDDAFLTELYQAGGLDYLDAVSWHPYDYGPGIGPEFLEASLQNQVAKIKEYNNGESKPIWITELGWSTAGYSEQEQADNLVRAQAIALANGVEKFFWYDLVNDETDITHHEGNFGLVRQVTEKVPTFAPKPSAVAQAVLIRQVAGKPYTTRDQQADTSVYSYAFGSGKDVTRVVWATTAKTLTYSADTDITVTDQFGATVTVKPVDGRITIEVDGHPRYLNGVVSDLQVVG
ncbi:glycosyl hydrolase [Cryobacterium arcticum]|uniref:glycosyl hydrolase n=1 Tax=Cryobacterium arcticum TaxID=670052 RepID=UPI0015E83F0A|nr:glycosyl hydrolase [Cryobacterium arcticum]